MKESLISTNIPEKLTVPESRELARNIAKSNPETILEIAKKLLSSENKTHLRVGINVLLLSKEVPADFMKDQIKRLGIHEDWELREEATQVVRALLKRDFDIWFPLLQDFIESGNVNLQRAAVVGSMATGIKEGSQIRKIVEQIYEPVLSSNDRYIRINLGPFAFGSFFLRLYPEIAFRYFDQWIERKDPWTRWNVIMAFSAARAKEYPNEAKRYIEIVKGDPRPIVQRAVKSVSRKIT